MARKTQELENKEADGRNVAERPSIQLGAISSAIESFSRQFATTVEHFDAQNQADDRQRRDYEGNEFKWTKIAAKAAIGFSAFSLILSWLTLRVLSHTLDVYRKQTALSELGLIAEVGIAKPSACNAAGDTILTFTNTGHTKAKNVVISTKLYGTNRKLAQNFDPFTAIGARYRQDLREAIDGFEKMRRRYLDEVSNNKQVDAGRKAAEKIRLNQLIDERERLFKKDAQETIERERTFLPPSYVEEIPAGGSAEYRVSIGWELASAGRTAMIYGTYGYDDELGHPHKNNRFCWRYESGQPFSCLQFQPVKPKAEGH